MNGSTTPTGRLLARTIRELFEAARTLADCQRGAQTTEHLASAAIDRLALAAVAWANADRRHAQAMAAYGRRALRDQRRAKKEGKESS